MIDIKSKGTFSSEKEPIGKVWYIAQLTYIIQLNVSWDCSVMFYMTKWKREAGKASIWLFDIVLHDKTGKEKLGKVVTFGGRGEGALH